MREMHHRKGPLRRAFPLLALPQYPRRRRRRSWRSAADSRALSNPIAMQVVDLAPVIVLTAVGGVIAPWSRMPLPIFLVVVGAAASFLPGLQAVKVDPEVFLLLFIPPLLFADARVLPRRDLIHVLKPVLLLALGLVVLTVVAVGYFIHWLIPSIPARGRVHPRGDRLADRRRRDGGHDGHRAAAGARDAHRERREPAQRRHGTGRLQARRGGRRGRGTHDDGPGHRAVRHPVRGRPVRGDHHRVDRAQVPRAPHPAWRRTTRSCRRCSPSSFPTRPTSWPKRCTSRASSRSSPPGCGPAARR